MADQGFSTPLSEEQLFGEKRKLKCRLCPQIFIHKNFLKRHIQKSHCEKERKPETLKRDLFLNDNSENDSQIILNSDKKISLRCARCNFRTQWSKHKNKITRQVKTELQKHIKLGHKNTFPVCTVSLLPNNKPL